MTQSVDSLSLHSFVRQPTLGKSGWTVYVCGAASVCLLLTGIAAFSFSQFAEAEVPADVALEFDSGKPWPISGLVR